MRTIEALVVHQSDSEWGNAAVIRGWHESRGWTDIGYHFVILNGRTGKRAKYDVALDGHLELGRPVEHIGAHVAEHNARTIGICLIGKGSAYLTMAQMATLLDVCHRLRGRYNLPVEAITGHREYDTAIAQGKTCPGFDCERLRAILRRLAP